MRRRSLLLYRKDPAAPTGVEREGGRLSLLPPWTRGIPGHPDSSLENQTGGETRRQGVGSGEGSGQRGRQRAVGKAAGKAEGNRHLPAAGTSSCWGGAGGLPAGAPGSAARELPGCHLGSGRSQRRLQPSQGEREAERAAT